MKNNDFELYRVAAEYISERIDIVPEIAIVLGTDLGEISQEIHNQVTIDYKEIPNFLQTTVSSHPGKLVIGEYEGRNVVCMMGRFHYYEGYDFEELTLPVRVLKLLGVKKLILTNAAGAVNSNFNVGDLMIISDHIKLMGASPLRGQNMNIFGPRFFDVSDIYSKSLRMLALSCAKHLGITAHEGVYFFMPGPQFETKAEIRIINLLGGDAVGMSTVTEALTAAHCGMEVLGISLLTNYATGIMENSVSTIEVEITAKSSIDKLGKMIGEIINSL